MPFAHHMENDRNPGRTCTDAFKRRDMAAGATAGYRAVKSMEKKESPKWCDEHKFG